MVCQALPIARAAAYSLPLPGLRRRSSYSSTPLLGINPPNGTLRPLHSRIRPLSAAANSPEDSDMVETDESLIQEDPEAADAGAEPAPVEEENAVVLEETDSSMGLVEAKPMSGRPVIMLTENKKVSGPSLNSSGLQHVKYGAAGVGAAAICVVMGAGIWSLWTHKDDENLRLQMKKSMKDMVQKMEELKSEHEDELQKVTWEYSSKLSAKESEARAMERQLRDAMNKQFLEKLANELREREKKVTASLTAKHQAEMSRAESQWETKLQMKRVEIAKLREAAGEASAELGKQMKSAQISKQKYLKREEDFEKKALRYSKAISAVAPGGTIDALKDQVSALNTQIRVQERELRKLNQTPVSPNRNGAKAVESVQMVVGATMIPNISKKDTGGEDAFFVSSKGFGAIGVADGVGGWAEDGIDPALYPRKFMEACSQMYNKNMGSQAQPLEVLLDAYGKVKMPGSATVVIASLNVNGDLEIANVGDCGVRVVRAGECVFATKAQVHEFNMPYQLGCVTHLEDTDHPSDASIYHFQVQRGDVIVAGSDGLFDNIFDKDLAAVVGREVNESNSNKDPQLISQKVAELAHENAQSESIKTPWAVEFAAAGQGSFFSRLRPQGGKMDDCTVVVGWVE